jgi:hypothetical protein
MSGGCRRVSTPVWNFAVRDWFRSSAAVIGDTYQQMLESGVGTVITDVAGRRDVLHMRLTTPVAFISFVTNSLHPKDYVRADAWVETNKTWVGSQGACGRCIFLCIVRRS